MTKRWRQSLLVPCFVLLLTMIIAGCGASEKNEAIPTVGLEIGDRAPDFSLQTSNGKTLKLSDLRGKPVVLNFWATWCPYCVKEMPDLNQTVTKNPGVQVLTINVKESPMVARSFLARQGWGDLPIGFDEDGKVANLYQVTGLPTSYGIDAEGVIRLEQTGALTASQFDQWFKQLQAGVQ